MPGASVKLVVKNLGSAYVRLSSLTCIRLSSLTCKGACVGFLIFLGENDAAIRILPERVKLDCFVFLGEFVVSRKDAGFPTLPLSLGRLTCERLIGFPEPATNLTLARKRPSHGRFSCRSNPIGMAVLLENRYTLLANSARITTMMVMIVNFVCGGLYGRRSKAESG